jgi:hypothetical protein
MSGRSEECDVWGRGASNVGALCAGGMIAAAEE